MDEVVSRGVSGAVVPLERFDPLVDEMLAFIIVASVSRDVAGELIAEAFRVFDGAILPAIRDSLDEAGLYFLDYVGVDAMDLVDCMGGDALSETLSWAVNTLVGHADERPGTVETYARCVDMSEEALGTDDRVLASAIMYSFIAALNRLAGRLL